MTTEMTVDEPRPDRRSATVVPVVSLSLLTAGLCAAYLVHPDGWFGDSSYLVVTVGASALAWWGVRLKGGPTRVWLALGVTASALGDVLFQLYVMVRGVSPDVSMADGPWIGSYIAVGMAMLVVLRRGRQNRRGEIDGLIDGAVIMLVSALILWQFWLNSTFTDTTVPLSVRCVWAVYPVLDAALLALVVRTVIERRAHKAMGALLVAGVACWLLSDFSFMTVAPEGFVSAILDVGWMLGAMLLAAAGWYDSDANTASDAAANDAAANDAADNDAADNDAADNDAADNDVRPAYDEVGKVRIALAIAPLLVPGVIELISYSQGEDANPVPLLAATVAFAGLATARALRLLRLRDEAQQHLASSEQLFRALAANSSDAVLMLDADGWIINDAPNLATLVGYPGTTTKGHRALDFVSSSDVESVVLLSHALRCPGVVLSGEAHLLRPDGRELWLSTRVVNLLDEAAVHSIVVNVHDITDRKLAEEELIHQAFHDSLTGLANRALFRDRVEHSLARRSRTGMDPAVIYLDLDGFKNVNDGLGHDAGDLLLEEVARRLQAVVRSGDTVARLGGDEFAVLVEESHNVRVEAESIAERVLQSLTEPITLDGSQFTLSASLGIANAEADSTASALLRDADIAMYQAKTSGKSRWVVYEPTMRAAAFERLQLESDLGRAVDEDQLRLVYQPVIELATDRIVGFEALVRWDHPELGVIMPDRFIPLAEQNGSIIAIGRWVLQTACQTAARWVERFQPTLTMAVNLSGRQLASSELTDHVRQALTEAGLDPGALVLEMTETALIEDPEQASIKLHELRALGVRLAIDDFGTGYSSLSYLQQFPVDIIKIDRSFISAITDREHVPAIMRGLLDLSRTMHLETVAEGIESHAQLGQLRDQQCELGQGYLFSRPLPADEAERLLPESAYRVTI